MKPPTPTVSIPSSLQTTQHPKHDGDARQRILIGSFVGVAVVLVMILLFAIYCYNKRNPIQSRHTYVNRHTDISPTTYVYVNKGLQHADQDTSELSHDVSLKLNIQWDEMYGNTESEKFKTLRDQIVESMEDLYKQYCEFRGAILLKLRKGSVIADIRLKFSKLAVEPLNIIKTAVSQGKCSLFEVEKDYFRLQEEERRFRHSRSDKTESGYGSQVFEHITFVDKSQEQKLTTSSPDKLPESISDHKSTVGSVNTGTVRHIDEVEGNVVQTTMGRSSSSSRRVKSKKKNVTNKCVDHSKGRHHVARFDFQPQDYRELALHQGEMVRITSIDAGGWVKVINGSGEEGWVPRNFIAEIDPEDYINTKKAVESIIFLDQMIESADIPDDEAVDDTTTQDDDVIEDAKISSSDVVHSSYENIPYDVVCMDESLNGLFVTIFPFDPTDAKELKLEVGDLIDVSRTSETGWWKGCCVRTSTVGWFPSTYVKPKSAELNFQSFFGDLSHVEESVSDSELQSSKRSPISNGYYSDNEENKVEEKFMLRGGTSGLSYEYEDIEDGERRKDGISTSSIIHSSGSFTEVQPSTSSKTYETHTYYTNPSEPPAKPVPPKPRKQHMRQTYQKLAAKGQLCSTNDLMTRSLESLRVRSKSGSRRYSEEIYTPDGDCNKQIFLRPIEKDRPLSFQGAPRFVHLANRYASNMKASWSLPSLNGDQIKLSPDDDRPYLEPIPRKNKTTSVEILDSKIKSGDVTTDEYIELNPNMIPERLKTTEAEQSSSKVTEKDIGIFVNNENDVISTKNEKTETRCNEPPPKPQRDSLKYGFSVTITSNDDTKINKKDISYTSSPIEGNSDKHLPTCCGTSLREKCDCDVISSSNETKTSDDILTLKPCTRFRTSSNRNFTSFECINEEGESIIKKDLQDEEPVSYKDTDITEELGQVRNYVTMCLTNEHTKPSSLSQNQINDDDTKLKNEPRYCNVTCTKETSQIKNKNKLYFRKINSFGEEESEEDSSVSRASSSLSLSSFSSSNASRSTTSSKHEQMNLRRATMNVYGEGSDELSFKIGAMLYELRPRNKEGLCYGLLEDSTEGWYPAESVESFHASLQV